MKSWLNIMLYMVALCVLVGCSRPRVELAVASQPNVNPDYSGRPSPVVVKVYELRNAVAFKQADFQMLFEHPMQALGADVVAADELVFVPGEARTILYMPGMDSRFLGIVAGFRQMERGHWRTLRPIDASGKNRIALELNDTSIILVPDAKTKGWDAEDAVKRYQPAPEPQPASTRVTPTTRSEDTLTSYDTPPEPRRVPKPDPEEVARRQRMPSSSYESPAGMAEPQDSRAPGRGVTPAPARPATEPYEPPAMRSVR